MGMGLRIGQDIKLAGFDDDPIATFLPVPLTTVRLPARPFAEAAFEAVMSTAEQGNSAQQQIIIDCELVVHLRPPARRRPNRPEHRHPIVSCRTDVRHPAGAARDCEQRECVGEIDRAGVSNQKKKAQHIFAYRHSRRAILNRWQRKRFAPLSTHDDSRDASGGTDRVRLQVPAARSLTYAHDSQEVLYSLPPHRIPGRWNPQGLFRYAAKMDGVGINALYFAPHWEASHSGAAVTYTFGNV